MGCIFRCWTLQTKDAWDIAQNNGYLQGNQSHVWEPLLPKYQWMMKQMKERLPEYCGEYPVWLWYKKPDMRYTGHFESNTPCVRLTVELEQKNVLWSDFDDWHCVLNNSFCADSEEEWENYYKGIKTITKEESWQRIFDLHRVRDPAWCGGENPIFQGVTGKIELSAVKKVEHFISRRQPSR